MNSDKLAFITFTVCSRCTGFACSMEGAAVEAVCVVIVMSES